MPFDPFRDAAPSGAPLPAPATTAPSAPAPDPFANPTTSGLTPLPGMSSAPASGAAASPDPFANPGNAALPPLAKTQGTQPEGSGILKTGVQNFFSGLISDTLASLPQIVEMTAPGMGLANTARHYMAQKYGLPDYQMPDAQWWDEQLAKAGLGAATVHATTPGEKMAALLGRGLGESVPMFASGEAIPELAVGPEGTSALARLGRFAGQAALGTGSLAGSEAGAALAPAGHEAAGAEIGGYLGGAGLIGGGEAALRGMGAAGRAAWERLPPMRAGTQEAMAGQQAADTFRAAATNPEAVVGTLRQQANQPPPVPNAPETSAEITNDPGLLWFQRQRESQPVIPRSPAGTPGAQPSRVQREVPPMRAAANDARLSFLGDMAPAGATPESAQQAVRAVLGRMDQEGDEAAAAARQTAAQQRAAVAPTMTPEEQGALAAGAVSAERQPAAEALARTQQQSQGNLIANLTRIGGDEALLPPEERSTAQGTLGAAMREPILAAEEASRQHERELYNLVDPEGTKGVITSNSKGAVSDILREFPLESGDVRMPLERHLHSVIENWPDRVPVMTMYRMRTNINRALRGNLEPVERFRLQTLKGGLDADLADTAGEFPRAPEEPGPATPPLPGSPEIATRAAEAEMPAATAAIEEEERRRRAEAQTASTAKEALAPADIEDRLKGTLEKPTPSEQPIAPPEVENAGVAGGRTEAGRGVPGTGAGQQAGPGKATPPGLGGERGAPEGGLRNAPGGERVPEEAAPLPVEEALGPRIIEGTHTKTGAPIVTVQLPQRIGSDAFKALAVEARKLGGRYSSYRGNGAIPGFIFKDRPSAERFAALARGEERTPEAPLPAGKNMMPSAPEPKPTVGTSRAPVTPQIPPLGGEEGTPYVLPSFVTAGMRSDVERAAEIPASDRSNPQIVLADWVNEAMAAHGAARVMPLVEGLRQHAAAAADAALRPLVESGAIPVDAANRAFPDIVNRALARAGVIHYVSSHDPWSLLPRDVAEKAIDAATHTLSQFTGTTADVADRSAGPLRPEEAMARLSAASADIAAKRSGRPLGAPGGAPGVAPYGGGVREGNVLRAEPERFEQPEPELEPFTEEDREALRAANAWHAQHERRFHSETGRGGLHAVGKILQRGGPYEQFRLTNEQVPWEFLGAGKTGANAGHAVERYLDAGGDPRALDNALAFSLRRYAQNEDGTINHAKWRKWLSDHDAALAQRPELLDRFRSINEAQKRLDEANEAIAAHEHAHPLASGWGQAGILKQFWKPGPQGGELMDRYLQMTGRRPEAIRAAEDYAALSFADRAIDKQTGEVKPDAARTWLWQHRYALSRVPGMAERFADAVRAQETVGDVLAAHAAAKKAAGEDFLRKFAGDDPERAIRRVFSGTDRTQKAELLMSYLRGTPGEDAIRRAALDDMRLRFEGAPVPGSEQGALRQQRLEDFLEENEGPLRVVFGPDAANFERLAQSMRRARLVQNAKAPGGSDTAEKMLAAAPRSTAMKWGMDVMAYIAGHVASHLLGIGGVGGEGFGVITAAGRHAAGEALAHKRTEFEILRADILDRMLLDPAFALDRLEQYRPLSPRAREPILRRLAGRAVQAAILAARGAPTAKNSATPYADGGGVRAAPSISRSLSLEAQGRHLADLAETLRQRTQKAAQAQHP